MQGLKKLIHLLLFLVNIFFKKEIPLSYYSCGNIKIQSPFYNQNSSNNNPSFLSHIILCKSQKLYYRTSIGLFQISSIDYKNKLLTISHHDSCSKTTSKNFISPHHLSVGFPNITRPVANSLILWNCKNPNSTTFLPCNDNINTTHLISGCDKGTLISSCSIVDDVRKLEKGFHPREMNCTHYSRVYRGLSEQLELGTRISFDVSVHMPPVTVPPVTLPPVTVPPVTLPPVTNPCKACNENCDFSVKCLCHPETCKNDVIGAAVVLRPCCNMFFYLVLFVVVVMGIF